MFQQELNLIINKAKKIYNNIENLEKNNQIINEKMIEILEKQNDEEFAYEYSNLNNSHDYI
jgi:hypothetical protein